MGISIWQLAVGVVLFLLLFGRGKIPPVMGDVAEGIKSFRSGRQDSPTTGQLEQLKAGEAGVTNTTTEQPQQKA